MTLFSVHQFLQLQQIQQLPLVVVMAEVENMVELVEDLVEVVVQKFHILEDHQNQVVLVLNHLLVDQTQLDMEILVEMHLQTVVQVAVVLVVLVVMLHNQLQLAQVQVV